jgi:DNA-binding NarL/FixJ family response regulator
VSRVVAFVPDLMDRSRLSSGGRDVSFVDDPARLAERAAADDADVVVVDLTRPGVLEAVAAVGVPVVGFANHTERELMDAARAAGCRSVLARSAFFSRLGDVLGAFGSPEGAPTAASGTEPARSPSKAAGTLPHRPPRPGE